MGNQNSSNNSNRNPKIILTGSEGICYGKYEICINMIPNVTYYRERDNKILICENNFEKCMNQYNKK